MFGFGKKKKVEDYNLFAPVSGKVIDLSKVDDPVFSGKMMGDGFAIKPSGNEIFSPVTGKITMLEGHAVGFERTDGLECLLHLGLETVTLNGEPFNYSIKVGDSVTAGQLIGTVDWQKVKSAGLDETCMLIFSGMISGQKVDFNVDFGETSGNTIIGKAELL